MSTLLIQHHYGHQCQQITSSSRAGVMEDSSFETFKTAIQNGQCGILLMGGLKTGCRNSYWSQAGHYIAVVGYSGGKYQVYDPAWDRRDGYHDWSDFQENIKHVYVTNIKWGSGSSTVTSAVAYTFSCDQIGSGANNKYVKFLQTLLKGRGYDLSIDGAFGDKTYKAVIDFQKTSGLTADGVVGIKTWRKLIPCESSSNGIFCVFSLNEISYGSNAAECWFVQNVLKGLGYYAGTIDLSFGDGCEKAVIAFQKANGMAGDGNVGKNTYRKLIGF